jgi:drug/metabolite transporter (DMT)-like permease
MWIIFGLLAAFFQSAGMALKKKALQFKGVNNFIAFTSFTIAGIAMFFVVLAKNQSLFPAIENPLRFWQGLILLSVLPNTFAIYFLYKALDITDLNHLMPFIAITTIFQAIPPIFIFGEIPSFLGIIGMLIIIFGAVLMEYKKRTARQETEEEKTKRKNNRKGVVFFLITLLFWTLTPTGFKMVVEQTNSVYASAIIGLFIGLSFIPMMAIFRERNSIAELFSSKTQKIFIVAIALAGLFIAGEYWAMNAGYAIANVAYIMALKRVMPAFAFIIGYLYFKERADIAKKILATAIMIAGAAIISLFG